MLNFDIDILYMNINIHNLLLHLSSTSHFYFYLSIFRNFPINCANLLRIFKFVIVNQEVFSEYCKYKCIYYIHRCQHCRPLVGWCGSVVHLCLTNGLGTSLCILVLVSIFSTEEDNEYDNQNQLFLHLIGLIANIPNPACISFSLVHSLAQPEPAVKQENVPHCKCLSIVYIFPDLDVSLLANTDCQQQCHSNLMNGSQLKWTFLWKCNNEERTKNDSVVPGAMCSLSMQIMQHVCNALHSQTLLQQSC